MTWATIVALGLLGWLCGVSLGLVHALTKRVRRLEAAQEAIARSALLYEASLSPLHQELRHLSESLRQLQESPHHHQHREHPQDQPRMFLRRFPWLSRIMTVTVGSEGVDVKWAKIPEMFK